ncbi:hypothetical protein [uncultured Friedmanniella sp.]
MARLMVASESLVDRLIERHMARVEARSYAAIRAAQQAVTRG